LPTECLTDTYFLHPTLRRQRVYWARARRHGRDDNGSGPAGRQHLLPVHRHASYSSRHLAAIELICTAESLRKLEPNCSIRCDLRKEASNNGSGDNGSDGGGDVSATVSCAGRCAFNVPHL